MDFKLIDTGESKTFEMGDSLFFYRVATPSAIEAIYAKHQRNRGGVVVMNTGAAHDEIIATYCTGWENVTINGQVREFDVKVVQRVQKLRAALLRLIRGEEDEADGEPGNP